MSAGGKHHEKVIPFIPWPDNRVPYRNQGRALRLPKHWRSTAYWDAHRRMRDHLSAEKWDAFRLVFVRGKTYAEVGERYGLTRQRIGEIMMEVRQVLDRCHVR